MRASFCSNEFDYALNQNLSAVTLHSALTKAFELTFPIEGKYGTVHFVDLTIQETDLPVALYKERKETLACRLSATFTLQYKNGLSVTDTLVIGQIPQMNQDGMYLVNGVTKVVLNAFDKADGLLQDAEAKTFTIVPESGAWIDLGLTSRGMVYAQIDKGPKFPASYLWEVFGTKPTYNTSVVAVWKDEQFCLHKSYFSGSVSLPNALYQLGSRTNYSDLPEWVPIRSGDYVVAETVKIRNRDYPAGSPLSSYEGRVEQVLVTPVNAALQTQHKYGGLSKADALKALYTKVFPKVDYDVGRAYSWLITTLGSKWTLGDFASNKLRELVGCTDLPNVVLGLSSMLEDMTSSTDVDSHQQKRVWSPNAQIGKVFGASLAHLVGGILYQLDSKSLEQKSIKDVLKLEPATKRINSWFATSAMVQFADQDNVLSEVAHKRRTSMSGSSEVDTKSRDVHVTQYGRLCPIETPEGGNIGTVGSLAATSQLREDGFVRSPYYVVENGVVTNQMVWLTANEEQDVNIAPLVASKDGIILESLFGRRNHEPVMLRSDEVNLIEASRSQILSAGSNLIPFVHHDDGNRALMGANMQRQAVPLIRPEVPIVGTGFERLIADASFRVVTAKREGVVVELSPTRILVKTRNGVDSYDLIKWERSNQSSMMHHTPCVSLGCTVKAGQVLADFSSTKDGELALGRNLLVAFMPWNGLNYEDSIVLSEEVVASGKLDSVYMTEVEVECKTTQHGLEEFTADIPDAPGNQLALLDSDGLVYVGTKVKTGDYLVGKVTPKPKTESLEDNLLRAIFGAKVSSTKNTSEVVLPGVEGTVTKVSVIATEQSSLYGRYMAEVEAKVKEVVSQTHALIAVLEKVNTPKAKEAVEYQTKLLDRKIRFLRRTPKLPAGTLAKVTVTLSNTRRIRVGDKLAGRHGNKGIVSRIVQVEDMPFLQDGTPVEVLLNPLGVPSRMNVGQILETHLGGAALELSKQLRSIRDKEKLAKALGLVYQGTSGSESTEVRLAVPAFVDCQDQVERMLGLAGLTHKSVLYDGRTGERFDNEVTVGVMYMLKLHHMVDDKMHARSVGPYSQITQQPLGGKARFGGQRIGEMEVWALEAYGASAVLEEMMTCKSDDVEGRQALWDGIVKNGEVGTGSTNTGSAFALLCRELNGLGLDLEFWSKK